MPLLLLMLRARNPATQRVHSTALTNQLYTRITDDDDMPASVSGNSCPDIQIISVRRCILQPSKPTSETGEDSCSHTMSSPSSGQV
jgi:hypothetical protein